MPKHIISLRSVGHENIWKFVREITTFVPSSDNKISKKMSVNLLMAQESEEIVSMYTKSLEPLGLSLKLFSPNEWNFDKKSPQNNKLDINADLHIVYGLSKDDLDAFCDTVKGNVFNASNADGNICAVLGDFSLIHSLTPEFDKIRIAWIGGATPLANSLIEASVHLPFELFMALPMGQEPNKDLIGFALSAGAKIFLTRDVNIAADNANYVYLGNISEKSKNSSVNTIDYIKQAIKENSLAEAKFLIGTDNTIKNQLDTSWIDAQANLHKKQIINNINAQTYMLSWLLSE